jgi:hypothetical protein
MKKYRYTAIPVLAGAGLALVGSAAHADIVYDVSIFAPDNNTQLVIDFSGSVTTDGVLGTLSASDILSYQFSVAIDSVSSTGSVTTLTSGSFGSADPGNSVQISGNDLTATRTDLVFNISGTDGGSATLGNTAAKQFIMFDAASGSTTLGSLTIAFDSSGSDNLYMEPQAGMYGLGFDGTGSAVPLPASAWALGSALLGFLSVIRKRAVPVTLKSA